MAGGAAGAAAAAGAKAGPGAAAGAGHANGFPAAGNMPVAAGGGTMGPGTFFGNPLGFSPFAGPSYAIPSLPGGDTRTGRGAGKAGIQGGGGGTRSLSSQLGGPATQPDGGGLGASQGASLGLGGFGSLGSMLTQASGGLSQFGGSSLAFGYGGGGTDDFGAASASDAFLTQGPGGLSQAAFGDVLATSGTANGSQAGLQQNCNRLGS